MPMIPIAIVLITAAAALVSPEAGIVFALLLIAIVLQSGLAEIAAAIRTPKAFDIRRIEATADARHEAKGAAQ